MRKVELGGPPQGEISRKEGKENQKPNGSYLLLTEGHYRLLAEEASIASLFSDQGVNFPKGKDKGKKKFPVSVDVINTVGNGLEGDKLRLLRNIIEQEISNNLHQATINIYGTIVEIVQNFQILPGPRKIQYAGIMLDANDSLRQLSASNNLSDRILPDGFKRHSKEELAEIDQQLLKLNEIASDKGFPVEKLSEPAIE